VILLAYAFYFAALSAFTNFGTITILLFKNKELAT
jgi:hypothetical protein